MRLDSCAQWTESPVYLRVVSQGATKVAEVPRSAKAVLHGHRRKAITGRQYPALVVEKNTPHATVEGLVRWVPESHIPFLDDWEEVVGALLQRAGDPLRSRPLS